MANLLWQQRQDIGPSARVTAITQSPTSGRTLLFGGRGAGVFGDTWEWDGEGWVQLEDKGPGPRELMGLTFDSGRGVVVLYGGWLAGNSEATDTWEWDGEGWTQVADTGPVVDHYYFSIVYDEARKTTLLEGGSVETLGVGTWGWDGNAWTQLADIGPAKRHSAGRVFDSARQRGVLFGGFGEGNKEVSDTWEWDGFAWAQIQDIGPARLGHAMSWFGSQTLLFGGAVLVEGSFQTLSDTWSWDGKHWRERQDIGPSARVSASMAWDPTRERAVLFGGDHPGSLGDTWEAFEEN